MKKKRSQPAARKPRTDALRNRERILEVAKGAFTGHGAATSLDELAPSTIGSCRQFLLLHWRRRRVDDGRNAPAIGRFDQLPGFATAVVGLAVDIKNEIEINSRDSAIRVDHDVAVFRVEILGCRGDQLREVTIAADTDFLGSWRLCLRPGVSGVCENIQPEIGIG